MKMNPFLSGLSFLLLILSFSCSQPTVDLPVVLKGDYLGQPLPSDTAELFAPGFISTGLYTRDLTMTPEMDELYFCVSALGYNLIFYSKQVDGVWTEPEPAPFISDFNYMHYEPHITADGKRLLFLSNMPTDSDSEGNEDIWAVDRTEEGWSTPYNLGAPVNTENAEFFPSTTKDGTLYFTRQMRGEQTNNIFRSRYVDGKYQEPEKLGPNVNCGAAQFNAFIDPDEKYIIVPVAGREDTYGATDYYIVFRDENDIWSEPVNMGEKINTEGGREYSPYVSPDGKYFFFMSTRSEVELNESNKNSAFKYFQEALSKPKNGNSDIYWIDAGFIEGLRPD
ncbi:MAG: hypothetical protein GY705_13420 [Bacteroidetes bacterium]|nr:hypothetical protein [Bacteroidota bacterium]